MLIVIHQGRAGSAPRPTASGVYHDQWRKTDAGWRRAHRAAHVDGRFDVSSSRGRASTGARDLAVRSRARHRG
jgi:hypothetical protein